MWMFKKFVRVGWRCLMGKYACASHSCFTIAFEFHCRFQFQSQSDVICKHKLLLHCSFVAFSYLFRVKGVFFGNNNRGGEIN